MTTILNTVGKFNGVAKKTKPLRCRLFSSIFDNREMAAMFRMNTLEGMATISFENVMCVGAVGEPWQQTIAAVLKKYTLSDPDQSDWQIATPKPENEVEYFIFREAEARRMSVTEGGWVIQGRWGETIDGIEKLQRLKDGDAVCRQPHDHSDQWVVRGDLFAATYEHVRDL